MKEVVQIKSFALGPLETNSYVVSCDDACWVIDVGGKPEPIMQYIQAGKFSLEKIIITHGHWDHIVGLNALKQQCPDVPVAAHRSACEALRHPQQNLSLDFWGRTVQTCDADELLDDGRQLQLSRTTWQVLYCPGHTQDSICLYCAQADVIFVGDVLFEGSVGRTDLPGGNPEQLRTSIREKLLTLPDATVVYPGHGPSTTIGQEKAANPWL